MAVPEYRLGDLIDDYCPRCRLLLNHAVASMVEGKVVKVICQTCHSEHPFRRGESAKKKKPPRARGGLFEQILSQSASAAPALPEPLPAPPAATPKKKSASPPARYITRHKTKPPRRNP